MSHNSALHLLCGMICTGKSTLAKKLEDQHQAVRFSPDEWLKVLMKDVDNREELAEMRPKVVELQWKQIQRLLQLGTNVIWDVGVWLQDERDKYREGVHQLGSQAILHYLTAPTDELKRRIEGRNKQLPTDSFFIKHGELEEWIEWLDVPTKEEGRQFDEFHVHSQGS